MHLQRYRLRFADESITTTRGHCCSRRSKMRF